MIKLPLYKSSGLPIERAHNPMPVDPGCRGCPMWNNVRGHVCMADSIAPQKGGVMVVGGQPSIRALNVEPFTTGPEGRARTKIESFGKPVTFAYAVKCAGSVDKDSVQQCRKYLLHTFKHAQPERVILFGRLAAEAFFGRYWNPTITRRGYATTRDGTPVFLLPDPIDALRNTVHKRWWAQDLAWAMEATVPPTPYHGKVHVIETLEDALEAERLIREHGNITYDTETFGQLHNSNFKIVCLAATWVGADECWVWPEEALYPGDPRREVIVRLAHDLPCYGHGVKYDVKAVEVYLGVEVNVAGCTLTACKLQKADGNADLNLASNLVGMGGHKKEAKEAEALAVSALKVLRKARDAMVVTEWGQQDRVDKNGRRYRRKVAVSQRPPTAEERVQQIKEAWAKPRKMSGLPHQSISVMFNLYGKDVPADWMEAALSDADEMSFVLGLIDRGLCHHYCGLDTVATARLASVVLPRFTDEKDLQPVERIYTNIVIPVIPAVARMERRGLLVDRPSLDEFELFLDEKIQEFAAAIRQYAPDMNPDSRTQVRAFLYGSPGSGGLGLPVPGTTKSGLPSTKADLLEKLKDAHPVVASIIGYAEVTKLQSNYARGMKPHIQEDGRVHCTFNITGTESGRFSCTSPNMQTLPSRRQYAKRAKNLFIAPKGYKLVAADFKALEIRVAAILSGDELMIEMLQDPELDFHGATARSVCHVAWGDDFDTCSMDLRGIDRKNPTEEQLPILAALKVEQKRRRDAIKTIIFAVLYGQTIPSTAAKLGISEKSAQAIQQAIFGRYKGLHAWTKRAVQQAKAEGGSWTWWQGQKARFRPIVDLGYTEDKGRVGHGERVAVNSPVQGSGSDFNTASISVIDRWILEEGIDASLVLVVHDSIVGEVADDDVDEYVYNTNLIMTSHYSAGVPIVAEIEVGQSYGAMMPYAEFVKARDDADT